VEEICVVFDVCVIFCVLVCCVSGSGVLVLWLCRVFRYVWFLCNMVVVCIGFIGVLWFGMIYVVFLISGLSWLRVVR